MQHGGRSRPAPGARRCRRACRRPGSGPRRNPGARAVEQTGRECTQQRAPEPAALLRMELDRRQVPASQQAREAEAIHLGGAGDDLRVRGLEPVAMHEIRVGATPAVELDRVPADVWDDAWPGIGPRREGATSAGQEGKAGGIVLVAPVEHELRAEADAEQRSPVIGESADLIPQPAGPQGADRGPGSAHAGQDEPLGSTQLFGTPRDEGGRTDRRQSPKHRSRIPRPEIDDPDHSNVPFVLGTSRSESRGSGSIAARRARAKAFIAASAWWWTLAAPTTSRWSVMRPSRATDSRKCGSSSSQGLAPDSESGRGRSEERRVGKECRARWSPYHETKKKETTRRTR